MATSTGVSPTRRVGRCRTKPLRPLLNTGRRLVSLYRMKVFVAGATGVVGQRAVAALVAAGHSVTGVARTAAKADLLRRLGAVPTEVDLFDRMALERAVAGHEAIVNLATKIPPVSRVMLPRAWAENDRIRTEVSTNLVDAGLETGAQRYVQESLGFIYPDRGDSWIDEDTSLDPAPHTRSTLVAERHTARFSEEGGAGVVLRFGQFYAPEPSYTASWIASARRGLSPFVGPPQAFWPFVHADDAGDSVVYALEAPAGVYNIAGEPATQKEAADALAAALSVKKLRFPPGPLMRLGGAKVKLLMRSQRVSNRRFRAVTDWDPRHGNVHDGFAAVVDAMSDARSA